MAISHSDLLDLGFRANVLIRTWKDKTIVIYDDHRWLLNVLFYLRKRSLFETPNIVYFDAHDDAADCPSQSELLEKLGTLTLDDATERQFLAFVEYDISPLDDNWLSVACELNMIKDAVCIGNRNNNNIENRNCCFDSSSGMQHSVYELSLNIDYETGWKGALGDCVRKLENVGIRSFFNTKTPYDGIGKMEPYVLDIDLDCFTLDVNNGPTLAWSPKIYERNFPEYSKGEILIQKLLRDAELITICREPDFCGSIGDSNKILSLLDSYWFEGSLGATSNY